MSYEADLPFIGELPQIQPRKSHASQNKRKLVAARDSLGTAFLIEDK
jgi:hypothetical protein